MSAPVQVGPSPSGGGPVPSPDWDDVLADIGDRVRAERQARGWTEEVLAHRSHLDRGTVRRIQQGIGSLRTLLLVCAGLDVDAGYLLSPEWKMPDQQGGLLARPRLSPTQVDVLRTAASGAALAEVAAGLGMAKSTVGSHLTRIYQQLGVSGLPQDQRRAAAARVAMQHGLFGPSNRTS